ncbi:response regulator [Steroidobacter sp.]|uniref:response regulator n=1 Tax=Steroidobacter sp. TaxID=1978227 RepID=UPI001A585DED|nr:response regulator [Steroidobacter sp.]MBL8267070.1 response regulator [Steroidobacter sp.]
MDKQGSVLIVEDDQDVTRAARVALGPYVQELQTLASVATLDQQLANTRFDAVLLDMNFAAGARTGDEGMSALARIRTVDQHLSVVLMTAYGGVQLAVAALKQGATDFVLKPWRNDKLIEVVLAAMSLTRSKRAADTLDLEVIERAAIERALNLHEGNISSAAASLGLSRAALYRRISKHGL